MQRDCHECAAFLVTERFGGFKSSDPASIGLHEVRGTRTARLTFRDRQSWLCKQTSKLIGGFKGAMPAPAVYLTLAIDCDCGIIVCDDPDCLYDLLEPNFSPSSYERHCKQVYQSILFQPPEPPTAPPTALPLGQRRG